MKRVIIIGAGQIGSRHLQSMRRVNLLLDITVVDPSLDSLKVAEKRFKEMPKNNLNHTLSFSQSIPTGQKFDLAIIATSSDNRAEATRALLNSSPVRYIIFEKMLFNDKRDYKLIGDLLKKKKIKAWVNCPMRIMPFFKGIKKDLQNTKIYYHASGGMPVLVASAIHYIDHISSLIKMNSYTVDTTFLDTAMESKRKGFLEIAGTLIINFNEGSRAIFTLLPNKLQEPSIVDISNSNCHYTFRSDQKALVAKAKNNWEWKEIEAPFPPQSQIGTYLIDKLLKTGNCELSSFEESSAMHFPLLEELLKFTNRHSELKHTKYPFT